MATTRLGRQSAIADVNAIKSLLVPDLLSSITSSILPDHTHSGTGQGGSLKVGVTDTDATPGSMLFAGAGGVIQEDNANLFWDDTNNELGVGTNAPDTTGHFMAGSAGAVAGFYPGLTVEHSGDGGINILTPAANSGVLVFGSPTSPARGGFAYNHSFDSMAVVIAGGIDFAFSSNSFDVLTNSYISKTGIRATLASAEGLYVPWVSGDGDATAFFGSNNASNNQNAIEAITDSGIGVLAVSTDTVGIQGSSATGIGTQGIATTTGTGGHFRSATGTGLVVNLTGVGAQIATFQDNGADILTIQDGGQLDIAEYLRHLGDTDTYWRFEPDRARLFCGAVEMLDAYETTTNYLNLHAGLVGINETANANMDIGLTIDQGTSDNEIFNARSSDVSAVLSSVETGTFLVMKKSQGGAGGAAIAGYKDSDYANYGAFRAYGYLAEAPDTTKTTAGNAIIELYGCQSDGADIVNTAANGNVLSVHTWRGGAFTALMILDEDADLNLPSGRIATGYGDYWDVEDYHTTAPSAAGYVLVDINGTSYKLLAAPA